MEWEKSFEDVQELITGLADSLQQLNSDLAIYEESGTGDIEELFPKIGAMEDTVISLGDMVGTLCSTVGTLQDAEIGLEGLKDDAKEFEEALDYALGFVGPEAWIGTRGWQARKAIQKFMAHLKKCQTVGCSWS